MPNSVSATTAKSVFRQRPTAVICDMDGLLVDSERMERRVWRRAAQDLGIELTDERFASFVGHPADETERQLALYYGPTFDVSSFRERCHAGMRALIEAEGVPLRPGAEAWLRFVVGLGIPLALATSSGPALVRERLGTRVSVFVVVVTRADVARGKPFPDIYLEAAARLGVAPGDCLALEDSPTGARAAVAAGMPVLVVPDLVPLPTDLVPRLVGVFLSLDQVRLEAARCWDIVSVASGVGDVAARVDGQEGD
ncbi:MAG: HAD family phosphatase [Gemmatimonadota bacterium]